MAALAVPGGSGVLQYASNQQLTNADQQQAQDRIQAQKSISAYDFSGLSGFIRSQFELFKLHRNTPNAGWSERLLIALRAFNGVYDPNKLAMIKQFGGSEVYAKLTAMKCRGASSLLRDIYLGPDKPWGLDAPSDPKVPDQIIQAISQHAQLELAQLMAQGQQISPDQIQDRVAGLIAQARQQAKKKAKDQTEIAEDKIQEMLVEGGFYQALAEFVVDLPLFPFAVLKGPIVRVMPTVDWSSGSAQTVMKPRLCWQRTSPFDLWWTPGASSAEHCNFIERSRVSRAELNDCLDLPGYNQAEVTAVLDEYGSGGLNDQWDETDAERAVQESRENPWLNRSGMINCLEFNGSVQGKSLIDYGIQVKDPIRDYRVQAWLIGTHVIKVQMSPSPRQRSPYYITSFEKVPGTPVGNALPDILSDVQDVTNATLRSLVNNLSISSGPQVVVNYDRIHSSEDGESLYPWKRWHVTSDPLGNNTQEPVSFFQPTSNSGELLQVYQAFAGIADDLSGIPRYLTGDSAGEAGRTASGLSMLMGNASKLLQTVAGNIDRDVIGPCLENLLDMILMTDQSGLLTGEESVRVMGVQVATQKETQRSRQLEFLQATGNPIDAQIVGVKGRAAVLRAVAKTIGLDGEEVVPSDEEILQMQTQQQAQQAKTAALQQGLEQAKIAELAAKAQGAQRGPTSTGDLGPRENLQQQYPGQGANISGGVQ